MSLVEQIKLLTSMSAKGGNPFSYLAYYGKAFLKSGPGIMTIATAIGAAIVALDDAMHLDQEEAFSALTESYGKYSETKSNLDSLNSELATTKERIQELRELQSAGTITLAEEVELSKLQNQNAELERKISLQEQLNNLDKQQAISDAKTAMDATSLSVAESVRAGDSEGKRTMKGIAGESTSIQAIRDDLEAVEEYKTKIQEMEQTIQDTEGSIAEKENGGLFDKLSSLWDKGDLSAQQEALDDYNKSLSTLQSDLSTQTEYLQTQLEALKLDPEANASAIAEIESALNEVAGIDLSPIEQQYKQIESAFSATSGNDFIRDRLIEAAKSGEDVVDVLHEMGLTLSDLGIKGEGKGDAVRRYFDELAESAEQAQDAIDSVDGSVEGVTAAFESANQDADWQSMSGYLSQAQEMYEQYKVGTDDFQTAAQFMTYDRIDASKFKYDADAYVDAWEKAQGKVARYFDENNPVQSVTNALTDLQNKGLAQNVGSDDFDFTDAFKTSADAAKAWGVSVDAAETMMHNMEAYGFECDDVFFSGDGLSRYEVALTNLKTIRDEMEAGGEKDRLSGLIEGWDEEYAKYQNDLSMLSEEQIVRIEFEYDLASIQQQIDQLKSQAEAGGTSQTWAELIAGQKSYRETAKEGLGLNEDGIEIPVQYTAAEDSIATLQSQLMGATEEEKVQIQAEISNLYDIQNDLLKAFDTSGMSWTDFLQSDNAQSILSDLSSSTEEAMQNVADILGMDVEDLKINVDADTTDAENKLNGIAANDGKHIVMEVDATTDQIQAQIDQLQGDQTLTFRAEVDGIEQVVNAVRNEDGTITYTATIDGVKQVLSPELNKDGTIDYHVGDVPTTLSPANQDVIRNPDNSKVAIDPFAVNQSVIRNPDNSGVMSNPSPVYQTVIRTISNVVSTVKGAVGAASAAFDFNGTAHVSGTARKGTALLSGDWSVKKTEKALVGELGQETVVRNGHFFTVGDHGAEFVNLRRGDVVFNHRQSAELFKNGYVTSGGGRAKVIGGSFAEGTAYANGGRWPFVSSGSSSTHTSSSSSSNKVSSSTSSSAAKAASSAAKAASSASSAASSAAEAADEFKEKFDEVEIWLDRFDRTLNNLTDSIETYSYDLSKQSSVSDQAMNHIRNNLSTLQSAYNRYIQEANSVGLDSSWISKIQNGSINVETITDEDLKEKIDEYQDW